MHFNLEVAAKRLELLRQLVPKAARIAVLANPANVAATDTQLRQVEAAARAMGLQIEIHNANSSKEMITGMCRRCGSAFNRSSTSYPFGAARLPQQSRRRGRH
jgi:hypothetical protein